MIKSNGNGIDLINSATSETAAHYEYSPFGKTISQTGYYAETNKFRFSTKRFEESLGLYYYGFRYYKPKTGNWLTRDRIGETGGVNLYGFIQNNTINMIDFYGLRDYKIINCDASKKAGTAAFNSSLLSSSLNNIPKLSKAIFNIYSPISTDEITSTNLVLNINEKLNPKYKLESKFKNAKKVGDEINDALNKASKAGMKACKKKAKVLLYNYWVKTGCKGRCPSDTCNAFK